MIDHSKKTSKNELGKNFILDYGLKEYIRISKKLPHIEEKAWRLICILPHNAQFQPWINIESSEGKVLKFDSTNHLAKWKQPIQEYTTIEGIQEHEVSGWISGQAVVYEIPAGVKVLAVKYRETGYNTDFAGSFFCNDEDYNILWKKATRTCYLCMRDHFMDCPDRERTPLCLGDVCVQMEEIFYTFDKRAHELARKAIINNPNYTHIIDQNLMFAGEYGTWFYYMNTGDLETIRAQYPNLKKYLEKWKLGNNGVIEHNTDGWDWCDWGSPSKDKEIVQCCQYYSTLSALRKMAVVLGKENDLPDIDAKLKSIKTNFDEVFWKNSYFMSDDVEYPDERANAMAVITGLASQKKWESIFKTVLSQKLCHEWEDGKTYNASSYFERWVMEALCKMGKEEFVLLRMVDRYRDQIECRTTTLWEHFGRWWQTKFDPNSTLNHGWNSPNTILSRYIAGIEPVKPGWGTFSVCPKEAFLKSISVGIETVKGRVNVSIDKTDSIYTLLLSSPSETTAIVGIPTKSFTSIDFIKANGSKVFDGSEYVDNDRVHWKGEKAGYLLFSVGPGDWKFVASGKVVLSDAKPPRPSAPKQTKLDSFNWKVSASHVHRGPALAYEYGEKEGGSPYDAIDGDVFKGWSTGVPQKPGQWFIIDMGKNEYFNKIVLENGWAPYDYPREYKIYVSDNLNDWGEPVVSGKGKPSLTTITFPVQEGRYIKIDNCGSSDYWWSIFEADVYLVNDL